MVDQLQIDEKNIGEISTIFKYKSHVKINGRQRQKSISWTSETSSAGLQHGESFVKRDNFH
jgi:hypothetical protein